MEDAAGELLKFPQPLLLVGEAKLLQPLRKRLSQAWIEAGIELALADFPESAECCAPVLEALLREIGKKKPGTLLGFGGGKCLDTVKWAGLKTGLKVLTLPSSAATCACATAVVVEHDAQGAVLGLIDLPAAPEICIADLKVLETAPKRLLASGAADTLAKWLEWDAVEPCAEGSGAAKEAFEIISRGPETPLGEVLRANLRLSAEASNLGDAPAAIAHSFCAGLSLHPLAADLLHGEWVGLGLRFQHWLLERSGLGSQVDPEPALRAWGLPLKLPFKLDQALRRKIAERILAPDESMHGIEFPETPSAALLEEGLLALEP
jgi:glycerol dehydrogenase